MQTDSHLIAGLRMVHLAALPPTADRDGAMRGLAMVSWLGLMLLAAPAVAGDCEDWHAERFFARATVENVVACLNAGADPNARNETGATALHLAAWI